MVEKLVFYLKDFQWVDLLGFARIVGADNNNYGAAEEDFIDFVTEVVEKFSLMPRKDKKGLLKLARQISENNREYDEIKMRKSDSNAASRPKD